MLRAIRVKLNYYYENDDFLICIKNYKSENKT